MAEADFEESLVTAEMLSGVLRVDSYFSPRLLPRIRVTVRLDTMLVHFHNSLPKLKRFVDTCILFSYSQALKTF